ncbi:hypothetical protein FRX31_006490, partial [Thalictrum thalictroides]
GTKKEIGELLNDLEPWDLKSENYLSNVKHCNGISRNQMMLLLNRKTWGNKRNSSSIDSVTQNCVREWPVVDVKEIVSVANADHR